MDEDYEDLAVRRKETDAQRRKRLTVAISAVLDTDDGRLLLAEILSYCQPEAINGQEGVASGRIEGARSVGLQIIGLLRSKDPAGFMKLYREIFLP
jgi:hypothetical protein